VIYHPKHVEQLIDLNKLLSVASRWIIIALAWKLYFFIQDFHFAAEATMQSPSNPQNVIQCWSAPA